MTVTQRVLRALITAACIQLLRTENSSLQVIDIYAHGLRQDEQRTLTHHALNTLYNTLLQKSSGQQQN